MVSVFLQMCRVDDYRSSITRKFCKAAKTEAIGCLGNAGLFKQKTINERRLQYRSQTA